MIKLAVVTLLQVAYCDIESSWNAMGSKALKSYGLVVGALIHTSGARVRFPPCLHVENASVVTTTLPFDAASMKGKMEAMSRGSNNRDILKCVI